MARKKKGRKKRDRRHKLFSRAYTKAAALEPGQASTLTEAEDKELRRYLYPRPFQPVPCQICGHLTDDKDRDKDPWNLPRGVRVCGPCLYGKKDFWDADIRL